MADPSPTDPPAEQKPEPVEGQEPAVAAAEPEEPPEAKTYPESYVRQLRAESGTYRKKLAELEAKVQDFEDADKSENERMQKRLQAAEQRASDAETGLLRYQVAAERGLDTKAAAFLTGTTREEMELRAEELSTLLAGQAPAPRTASLDGGARTPAATQKKPEEEHNDFLMRALGRAPQGQ